MKEGLTTGERLFVMYFAVSMCLIGTITEDSPMWAIGLFAANFVAACFVSTAFKNNNNNKESDEN